ncbi:MAG: hypothetical protein ACYCYI_07760 [Saccharofermentanales bacterium]
MLAILYLVMAIFIGWGVKQIFRIDTLALFAKISGGSGKLPPAWTFDFPFYIIVGITILTTASYYLSYVFSLILPERTNPLISSNICLAALCVVLAFVLYRKKSANAQIPSIKGYFTKTDMFYWKSIWFFGLFSIFLIFYSFFVYNGILHSGATVFSDFAPHTAIISSFANGNNFPTQYPHFANDGIQYHFFFFYLCGNLLFLGMRIDLAMNVPSILGILCFTSLLGSLGVLVTKRRTVFFLAPFMLFFRSSYAIFAYLQELVTKKGATLASVLTDILKTYKFIGQTLHDDWGLWSMNVYANQRHFLWGFSVLLIVLMIFIPFIDPRILPFMKKRKDKPDYLSDPGLWKIADTRSLVFCCILIACLPYWHGSVMIALLCILFVLAFFSVNRLSFIIVAGTGVLSALLQAKFFSGGAGNVASPAFLWGFLSDDKSFLGVMTYLFQVLGISFMFLIILPIILEKAKNRILAISFITPLIFAICFSLTIDVTVNHKYIIIAIALLNIYIADSLCIIWKYTKETIIKKKIAASIALAAISAVITFSLCATGAVEMIGYINKNASTVNVDLKSPFTKWLEENTAPDDIFLTAPYAMNEFFFSGRKAFYGWPYFSWSAGHDTFTREIIVRDLFNGYGGDMERFLDTVKQNGIKYVIIDDELIKGDMFKVDVSFFKNNFVAVYSNPSDENKTVYRLY